MLQKVDENNYQMLWQAFEKTSQQSKDFFSPHNFDLESIKNLVYEKGNYYYLFYTLDGDFAGYGMLRTFDKYPIPTLGCIIWEKFRGKGYGKRIVEELLDKAKQLDFKSVKLKVYPDNVVAHSVYQKVGFSDIGESDDGQIWMEYFFK